MALKHYGVLRGQAVDARRESGEATPHYQVHIVAGGVHHHIAVSVRSQAAPSELLFLVNDNFLHPIVARLPGLRPGFTPVPPKPGGLALDFIRGNLFDRRRMRLLGSDLAGPDNDLSDRIEHFVQRAMREPQSSVYAFGAQWGPDSTRPDQIFGFKPSNGMHDIHMNQGNVPPFVNDDGIWQDGALMFHFPLAPQWVAIFLAFQAQSWNTDDNGHARIRRRESKLGMAATVEEPDRGVRPVSAAVSPGRTIA
jgi:uncharacterized protein YukJ